MPSMRLSTDFYIQMAIYLTSHSNDICTELIAWSLLSKKLFVALRYRQEVSTWTGLDDCKNGLSEFIMYLNWLM